MKCILFIAILFCASLQFAFGQVQPIATYIPKIVYYTTPHDDGHGFTSFKSGKGQKTEDSYTIILYKSHIVLKHTVRMDFKIDSTTNYRHSTNYFLTNSSGIAYEMHFLKDNNSIDRIEVIKLNKHRRPIEFTLLQMDAIRPREK